MFIQLVNRFLALVTAHLQQQAPVSPPNSPSDHSALASVLTELWMTLDTLALFQDPSVLKFPPHPEYAFDIEMAREAGYSQDAIDAFQQIPYVDDWYFEFLPNTMPISWLDRQPDLNSRLVFDGEKYEVMPASVFRLSRTSIYAYEFIYDAATSRLPNYLVGSEKGMSVTNSPRNPELVHPWVPFDDLTEPLDFRNTPGQTPQEVFGPIVKAYRKLHYFGTGKEVLFFDDETPEADLLKPAPENWNEYERLNWTNDRRREWALLTIRNIYLDCGWNIHATGPSQPTFRRSEFIERRDRYVEEVIHASDRNEEEIEMMFGPRH